MDIRPWLRAIPLPIAELMRRLGYSSYASFFEQISGKRPIRSVSLAKRIEAETSGAIRAAWILGLETPPAQPPSSRQAA